MDDLIIKKKGLSELFVKKANKSFFPTDVFLSCGIFLCAKKEKKAVTTLLCKNADCFFIQKLRNFISYMNQDLPLNGYFGANGRSCCNCCCGCCCCCCRYDRSPPLRICGRLLLLLLLLLLLSWSSKQKFSTGKNLFSLLTTAVSLYSVCFCVC